MRRLRPYLRFLSIFFILTFLQSLFQPSIVKAITGGPIQSEYTGYSEPNSDDNVNLLTGDFTYNLPLVHVPSPSGGFSLPLSYHAGISPDEIGTWVGLGWSMNAGAITRSQVGAFDDANGESIFVTAKDPAVAYGYDVSLPFHKYGWSSVDGAYGSMNFLNLVQWEFDKSGISHGVLGISNKIGYDGKISADFNPEIFVLGVITAASFVLTAGASSIAIASKNLVKDAIISAAFTLGAAQFGPKRTSSNPGFNAYYKLETEKGGFLRLKKRWKYHLNYTGDEPQYGVLNLHNSGTSVVDLSLLQSGTHPGYFLQNHCNRLEDTSKDQITVSAKIGGSNTTLKVISEGTGTPSDFTYSDGVADKPFSLAYDDYIVFGQGISGRIRPRRFEIGSPTVHRKLTNGYARFYPIPFMDYKVPFMYEGTQSNRYTFLSPNIGGNPTSFSTSVSSSQRSICHPHDDHPDRAIYDHNISFNFDGSAYHNSRIMANGGPYFNDYKLAQPNHVEWFKNSEIGDAVTNYGFVDYQTNHTSGRSTLIPASGYPSQDISNRIGGYMITRADGVTFHYAFPVYGFETSMENYKEGQRIATLNSVLDVNAFPSAWLLTAITGSDFVDRNGNGTADIGDWGQWTTFSYADFGENYKWRHPYSGAEKISDDRVAVQSGISQQYYLNEISTSTHKAIFMKFLRSDAKSVHSESKLGLKRIVVVDRTKYNQFLSDEGKTEGHTWLGSVTDLTSLLSNAEQHIEFTHDYSLCKNTPNSTHVDKGKLTLKEIDIYSFNNKISPSYKFGYDHNPDYSAVLTDEWGYATQHPLSGVFNLGNQYDSWSLTDITLPSGATIEVEHENDTYKYISGHSLEYEIETIIGPRTYDYAPGGGLRTKSIKITADGQENTLEYTYGPGHISKEPYRIKALTTDNADDSHIYDTDQYPQTPVMYPNTTVKTIKNGQYIGSTSYGFEVPDNDDLIEISTVAVSEWENPEFDNTEKVTKYTHDIADNTSCLGRVNYIRSYDEDDIEISAQVFDYLSRAELELWEEPSGLGRYSEGLVFLDRIEDGVDVHHSRFAKTMEEKYPNILRKITSTSNGSTSSIEHTSFNLITGNPDGTRSRLANGMTTKTFTIPAFYKYDYMGPKSHNPSNYNALGVDAAAYTVLLDADGGIEEVISGRATTFTRDMILQEHYAFGFTGWSFKEDVSPRIKSSYVYVGDDSELSSSGFYNAGTMTYFDHANPSANVNWQKFDGAMTYDKSSRTLQNVDDNGKQVATRYHNIYRDKSKPLATAVNANYDEFFHCGFENGRAMFDGSLIHYVPGDDYSTERRVSTSHTGKYALNLKPTEYVVFNLSNTSQPPVAEAYRFAHNTGEYKISMWVKSTDVDRLQVVRKNNTYNTEVVVSMSESYKAGPWSQLEGIASLVRGIEYTISFKSTSGDVLVDDIRMHPKNATVNAHFYNDKGLSEYEINNNNLYTKYIYDDLNRISDVYIEHSSGEKRVKSYSYEIARGLND